MRGCSKYSCACNRPPGVCEVRLRTARMIVAACLIVAACSIASAGARTSSGTSARAAQPFELRVSSPEIAAGFYTRLNALQGRNHTYSTSLRNVRRKSNS